MKKIISALLIIILCIGTFIYIKPITNYIAKVLGNRYQASYGAKNEYYKDTDYLFVNNTKDFVPYGYSDLLNIFYTTFNYGIPEITFYCPEEYEECLNDVTSISNDQELLTHISNYVNPLNSFSKIATTTSDNGEVTLSITKLYNANEVSKINNEVDKLIKDLITDDMDEETKIRTIHDYIINNSTYDVTRNDTGNSEYQSNTAYGPLFEGYATCSGYADLMAIFLNKLSINNYKIATSNNDEEYGHIWNAVYINNKWLHLDLTWDDPVSDVKDYLRHKYFLITTKELKEADQGEVVITGHNFDTSVYREFKEMN